MGTRFTKSPQTFLSDGQIKKEPLEGITNSAVGGGGDTRCPGRGSLRWGGGWAALLNPEGGLGQL